MFANGTPNSAAMPSASTRFTEPEHNTIDFVNMVFYRYAFGGTYFGETSLGFGSSISVTMFLIILICSLITRFALSRCSKGV